MKPENVTKNVRKGWGKRLVLAICFSVLVGLAGHTLSSQAASSPLGAGPLVQGPCSNTTPPIVPASVAFSALFGERVIYKLPVKDFVDDTLVFSLTGSSTGGPTSANLDTKTGIVTYQPLVLGAVNFTIKVTDCKGNSASTPITIDVKENPARPKILNPIYGRNKGLLLSAAMGDGDTAVQSNIREGATVVVIPQGGTLAKGESFLLELRTPRQGKKPRSLQWQVKTEDGVVSTPGKKLLREIVSPMIKFSLVVISDGIPSEVVPSTAVKFKKFRSR